MQSLKVFNRDKMRKEYLGRIASYMSCFVALIITILFPSDACTRLSEEYPLIISYYWPVEKGQKDIEKSISGLLTLEHLPWHHYRDTGRRDYDLRVLIGDLWFIEHCPQHSSIGMRLRCDSVGSGRPEQVAQALGFTHPPQSIHRTKLILKS